MLNLRRVCSLLLLLLFLTLTGNAQDRRAALEFYERGRQRYAKGDMAGAIANFTQAIELFACLRVIVAGAARAGDRTGNPATTPRTSITSNSSIRLPRAPTQIALWLAMGGVTSKAPSRIAKWQFKSTQASPRHTTIAVPCVGHRETSTPPSQITTA